MPRSSRVERACHSSPPSSRVERACERNRGISAGGTTTEIPPLRSFLALVGMTRGGGGDNHVCHPEPASLGERQRRISHTALIACEILRELRMTMVLAALRWPDAGH